MPMYDYHCEACGKVLEDVLIKVDEEQECPKCGEKMVRQVCAPTTFSTIVPTYPGSGAHKAGYIHKFQNRPAEKIQMGYCGGVSPQHPKGSLK